MPFRDSNARLAADRARVEESIKSDVASWMRVRHTSSTLPCSSLICPVLMWSDIICPLHLFSHLFCSHVCVCAGARELDCCSRWESGGPGRREGRYSPNLPCLYRPSVCVLNVIGCYSHLERMHRIWIYSVRWMTATHSLSMICYCGFWYWWLTYHILSIHRPLIFYLHPSQLVSSPP